MPDKHPNVSWKGEAECYYRLWQSAQKDADKWHKFMALIEHNHPEYEAPE